MRGDRLSCVEEQDFVGKDLHALVCRVGQRKRLLSACCADRSLHYCFRKPGLVPERLAAHGALCSSGLHFFVVVVLAVVDEQS